MYGSAHLQMMGSSLITASSALSRKISATGIIFNLEMEMINMAGSHIGSGEASMYKRIKSLENKGFKLNLYLEIKKNSWSY